MTETLERVSSYHRRHGKFVTEPRSVTEGGIVNSWGDRDLEHCLLDALLSRGYLGSNGDAQVRYDCGMELRKLYFAWQPSGKSPLENINHGYQHFTADDSEGPEDRYKAVMIAVPRLHRVTARSVCIEDRFAADRQEIQDMLDALFGALEWVRKKDLTAA